MEHEIHITVKTNEVDRFRKTCSDIGVKPIIIDLQDKTGNTVFHDLMTSSVYKGEHVANEVNRITSLLKLNGFNHIRTKIEVPPWHVKVPTIKNGRKHKPDNYFESHIRIRLHEENIPALRILCIKNKLHLSRNVFKKLDKGELYMMVTLRRDTGLYEDFKNYVDDVLNTLTESGYKYDKAEVEYVIYDSNKNHDKKWIENA